MLTASVYERDNRVLRYAQSLVGRGDEVAVVALGGHPGAAPEERLDGVRVVRVGIKSLKRGKLRELWSAVSFLVRASFWLARSHARQPYDLVHVHNMPDFLVFAAWYPRLRGAAVMLDIHDLFPEFYATRFGQDERAWLTRMLKRVERWCMRFSHHVIVSNHLWRETLAQRSVPAAKCSVFINSVDIGLFTPSQRSRHDDRLIVIYPGSLNWHQGLDIAIRAMAQVTRVLPQAELHLYGQGPVKQDLQRLARELKLNGSVRFFDPVPLKQVPAVLANADIGVVPKRASDFFGNQAFSTKIMEFMSQGLPVVVSRTLVDTYYYRDDQVRFVTSESPEELAQALVELGRDRMACDVLRRNGLEFVRQNSWTARRQEYLDLVDRLVRRSAVNE